MKLGIDPCPEIWDFDVKEYRDADQQSQPYAEVQGKLPGSKNDQPQSNDDKLRLVVLLWLRHFIFLRLWQGLDVLGRYPVLHPKLIPDLFGQRVPSMLHTYPGLLR